MNRLPILSATLAAFALLPAAERPLGAVQQVADQQVTITFDAGVQLAPGSVVAIYGPGRVEKHPLTKEVIIEDRKLLAKAQIIGQDGPTYQTRLAWIESGAALVAGLDAVPLPGEAAPNSPPVSATLPTVAAAASTAVPISLPISDPDGDPLWFSWRLTGPAGALGRLDARTTTRPQVTWFAPGMAASATLQVTVRDALGQEFSASLPLQGQGAEADLRNRSPALLGVLGANQKLVRLERDADGQWWGYDRSEASLMRIAPGWLNSAPFRPGRDQVPGSVEAIVPTQNQLFVLDGANRMVQVYNPDAIRARQLGGLARPTDLVVDKQGTVFVADQGAGGVLVFENNGRFRARLGQEGKGSDAFIGLSRLALGQSGELYCLDATQRQVQRFDRFQRRLDSWDIQGDVKIPPIDLAWHARGLLVLLASGQIQIFDGNGLAKEAMPPASQAGLGIEMESPDSLTCDAGGEIYVTYGASGVIARYESTGKITGLRGAPCSAPCKMFCQDSTGRSYGLDSAKQQICAFDSEGFLIARSETFARELADLAVSPDGTVLCALDIDKLLVHRLNPAALGEKPQVIGGKGTNNGQWKQPVRLTVDEAGRIYVLDAGLHRVAIFDLEGRFLFNVGRYERGKGADELVDPRLLAVAPAGDTLYVYDYDRYDVKKFVLDQNAKSGKHLNNAGGKGDNPGQIRKLVGLGCDRRNLIYLLDAGRADLQVLDFRGSNAVGLYAWNVEKVLGLRRPEHLAVLPDGGFLTGSAGSGQIYCW